MDSMKIIILTINFVNYYTTNVLSETLFHSDSEVQYLQYVYAYDFVDNNGAA